MIRLSSSLCAVLFGMVLAGFCLPAWGQSGAAANAKELIAVMDLQAVGASAAEAQALSDRLREVMLKTGLFKLVERSQMDQVLNEQALQQTGCTSQECAVQVGRVLGVRKMVVGKVVKVGQDVWLLSAILVDVESAETLRAESVRHKGDYFTLMDQRVAEIGAKMVEGATVGAAAQPAGIGAKGAQRGGGGHRVSMYPPSIGGISCNTPVCSGWPDKVLGGMQAYLASNSAWAPSESYKASGALPVIDSSSLLEEVQGHTWKGVFSVEPDVVGIVASATKLHADIVLLYKASGSITGGGDVTAYLVDVPTGKMRQQHASWLGTFSGYVDDAQAALKKLLEARLKER